MFVLESAFHIGLFQYDLTNQPQVIKALAEKHQIGDELHPLSLITMQTSEEQDVADEELYLRGRAVQLANDQEEDIGCVSAIVNIMKTLKMEGICNMKFDYGDGQQIGTELRMFLDLEQEVNEDLLLYHILIWKTAGVGSWTMERHPGEQKVVAYMPALLEASALEMSAEICSSGDHLVFNEEGVSDEVKELIQNEENWTEISLLEFVNETIPADKVEKARGSCSQPIIPVVVSKDRNLSWRCAVDSDNLNGETVFQTDDGRSYVRTFTDVRTQYEHRADRMSKMALGEFASQYRLLKPSGHGYEKAKSSINEETLIGPLTDTLVAGTSNIAAPDTMMLTNGKIMKRRQDVEAVPILLFSGCSSEFGNQLMWSPWRQLEEVTGIQDEQETEQQKEIRLQIFPLSVFPSVEQESADSENDL